MKKFFRSLVGVALLLGLAVTSLVSCDLSALLGGGVNNKFTVYSAGAEVSIITGVSAGDGVSMAAETLKSAISDKGAKVESALDIQTSKGSKIYVGPTSSAVTEYAKGLLSDTLDTGDVGYVICIKDGELAIYANDDTALYMAVDFFIEEYFSASSLILYDGVIKTFSMTAEEFETMKAQTEWENRWNSTELKIGAEATAAIKELYDFYGSTVYEWIANLYDVEHGGFYYANSARDTEGFLPDIESTTQALWLITATGLTKEYGDDLTVALPKSVVDKTLSFAYSLYDDSDGYFYHSQWGKNINSARKGRDLNSSLSVITKLGGKIPENNALNRLEGGNVEAAVARLVSSTVRPVGFLSSEAELLAWLEARGINNDSHGAGHTIESSASQIKAAGYSDLVISWLDSKQLDNGLWQEVDPANPYMALSGLLKIGSCYKNLGGQMKYCDRMIDTAIDVILSSVDPYIVIYVYNPWGGLKYALDNMLSANKTAPGTYDYTAAYNKVIDRLPDMIDVTVNKLSKFQKSDGSFSYYQKMSAAYTQGTLVSLGREEGDVNGTSLGMTTLFTTVFEILKLPVVRMYNSADYDNFISILNGLEPVEKQPKPDFEAIDFEDGSIPVYVSTYTVNQGSEISVGSVENADGEDNMALHVVSPKQAGTQITFKADESCEGKVFFAIDYDMKIVKSTAYPHQISLLTPAGSIAVMMTVHVSGNTVSFRDTSSNEYYVNAYNFKKTAKVGEWFHLRMEYHVLENGEIRFRLYVNGEYAGESDTFYGRYKSDGTEKTGAAPATQVERLQHWTMLSADSEFYLDNLDYEFSGEMKYEEIE